jgi:hypothetical protein
MNKTFNNSFEKGSNSISSLLRLAKEEQVRLNKLGEKINTRREAIDKVIDILEGNAFKSSINFTSVLNDIPGMTEQVNSEISNSSMNYPYNNAFITEPSTTLRGCFFSYGSVVIEVIINDFKYLDRYSENSQWDINLFKKETISNIRGYCSPGTETKPR